MESVVNYNDAFPSSMVACGNGRNVLILNELDKPVSRFDGKTAKYELEYRWLSADCQNSQDQSWACVQGSDAIFLKKNEISNILSEIKKSGKENVNLFNYFNLWS